MLPFNQMTGTQKKLERSCVMLDQAMKNSHDYPVFISNIEAFVTFARSVTMVMQTEFSSIQGFKLWFNTRMEHVNKPEFEFFNRLRVDTTHIKPFEVDNSYFTKFD